MFEMYKKKCTWCGVEFKSTQPNAKYCCKYHAGKARKANQEAKKIKNKE